MDSVSSLDMGLFRFLISSWDSFGNFHFPGNLWISSNFQMNWHVIYDDTCVVREGLGWVSWGQKSSSTHVSPQLQAPGCWRESLFHIAGREAECFSFRPLLSIHTSSGDLVPGQVGVHATPHVNSPRPGGYLEFFSQMFSWNHMATFVLYSLFIFYLSQFC